MSLRVQEAPTTPAPLPPTSPAYGPAVRQPGSVAYWWTAARRAVCAPSVQETSPMLPCLVSRLMTNGPRQVDGGYEDGYAACPRFWDERPASLVTAHFGPTDISPGHVLDLGCGEGNNAAYFASRGSSVDAVDCSALAL